MKSVTHILYVEDDETSRMVMDMILPYWGQAYELTMFADSIDFMGRLKDLTPQPDLIFMDIHMSPLNGFQMLERLRSDADYSNLTVIALTASVMNEDIHKLKQAGFDGAIAKPLNRGAFPDLVTRIREGQHVWFVA